MVKNPKNNEPVVSFQLNSTGGARFGKITGQNIGRPFAIVLDGKVVSAPVIRAQIFSEGQISGNFSEEIISYSHNCLILGNFGAFFAPKKCPWGTYMNFPTTAIPSIKAHQSSLHF